MTASTGDLDGDVLQALEGPRPFRRRFQERTLTIARQLLVEKQPAKVVAFSHGLSTKRIYAIKKRVLAAVADECGSGSALLSLEAPAGCLAARQRAAQIADACLRVLSGESPAQVAGELGISVDDLDQYCGQLRDHAWTLFVRSDR